MAFRYPGPISCSKVKSNGVEVKVREFLTNPPAPHYNQNRQNEPSIAVNPINSCNVVSAANDLFQQSTGIPVPSNPNQPFVIPFDLFANDQGIYTTLNGGKTWVYQPAAWQTADPPLVSSSDPVLAVGPKPGPNGFSYDNGVRFYFTALSNIRGIESPFGLATMFSDDGGITWSNPPTVIDTQIPPPNVEVDKPWIAVDNHPESPFFGNVYLAATYEPEEADFVVRSTDGGVTFGPPVLINPVSREAVSISIALDGTVYIFSRTQINGVFTYVFVKSTDGGQTYTSPSAITTGSNSGTLTSLLHGSNFRIAGFPTSAVSNSGKLFMSFIDASIDHIVLKLASSTDGGMTWLVRTIVDDLDLNIFFPTIATFQDQVVIGYNAITRAPLGSPIRAGIVSYDAYIVFSLDDGETFSDPVKVSRQSSDPAISSTGSLLSETLGDYNSIVTDTKGNFYFTWTDTRFGEPCTAVDDYRNNPSLPRPNIYELCSPLFGNTDIVYAKISFKDRCRRFSGRIIDGNFNTSQPIEVPHPAPGMTAQRDRPRFPSNR